MKINKAFLLYLCTGLFLFAQMPTEYEITKSGEYYYGEGTGKNYSEALNSALGELAAAISTNIQSSFKEVMEQKDGDFQHHAISSVSTYSNIKVDYVGILQLKALKAGETRVLTYLSKAQVEEMFNNRKFLITDYYKRAEEAMSCYRIGTALQYYYWSYCLLWTHPQLDVMKVPGEEGSSGLLISELESKINQVFSSIRFIPVSDLFKEKEKFRRISFDVKYVDKGQFWDVVDLEYWYWNGNRPSKRTAISNGQAMADMYGEITRHLVDIEFNIEYQYEHMAARDPMLTEVIRKIQESFKSTGIRTEIPFAAQSKILVDMTGGIKDPSDISQTGIKVAEQIKSIPPDEAQGFFDNRLKKNVDHVINCIQNKDYTSLESYFTENGKDVMVGLLRYGNAEILPGYGDYRIWKMSDERYMLRSVPMKFSFSDMSREFIENVVFMFDRSGKIEDINFALSDIAISDIHLRDNNDDPIEEKTLIHFLETYKTAYSLKRIDYLESIFSQDALIIVGRTLKHKGNIDEVYKQNLSEEDVELIKMTKEEYINHLKDVFRYSEGINLKFERTKSRRYGDLDIWGIELEQSYYSSRYADWGYLFLMIDLRDTLNPIIHVRTWQPKPNKEGQYFSMKDFPF